MKDIAVLKQAKALNQLVAEDRITAKDLPKLIEEGLDPQVVETWVEYSLRASTCTEINNLLNKDIIAVRDKQIEGQRSAWDSICLKLKSIFTGK